MTRNASIADFPEPYQRQIAEKLKRQERASPSSQKIIEQVSRDAAHVMRRLANEDAPKSSKYRNVKTAYKSTQGFERVYDSKREAAYAATLDQLRAAGTVKWWLPQVRLSLPGSVNYVVDFVVDFGDHVSFVDVKGFFTQHSKDKIKQVRACYGIEVEVVK